MVTKITLLLYFKFRIEQPKTETDLKVVNKLVVTDVR